MMGFEKMIADDDLQQRFRDVEGMEVGWVGGLGW